MRGGEERLQKILAHAGVGSRRACEELILQGRVTIGGQVVRELGTKVDPGRSAVAVDGQKVQVERLVYFAVYKPKGYVSTNNDPSGRPRVLDLLPEISQRVYTVGRLDEMSVGLMLLTNDGELANKLSHPKFGVEKLYRVIVAGLPGPDVLKQLTEGIWLAEGKVRAKRVRAVGRKGEATILEMVLAEGKNREVRRMLAKLGHKVMMLTRVAVGPITVRGLSAGKFRPLTGREVDLLRRVADGQSVPMPWMNDHRSRPEPDQRPNRPPGHAPGSPYNRSVQDRPGPPARRPEADRTDREPRPPRTPSGYQPASRPPGPGGPPPGPGRYSRDDSGPPRHPAPRAGAGGPPPGPVRYRQDQSGPPRRNNGPRPNQDGPPRVPSNRYPGPRAHGPGPGGPPPARYSQGGSVPPRRDGDGPRPNQGPPRQAHSRGHRPGPGGPPRRPEGQGQAGPRPPRPRPNRPTAPPSAEPPGRKVIGLDLGPTPTPERDDRPKPRPRPLAPRRGPGPKPKFRRRPEE